jgi:hypothetical protein
MFIPFHHKQKATILFHIPRKLREQTHPFIYVFPHPHTQRGEGELVFVMKLSLNLPYAYYRLLHCNLKTEALD